MTRAASNVVRLRKRAPEADGGVAVMKQTNKDKSPGRVTRWKEHPIIVLCVRFAANVGGLNGAFSADPTGNNDFAETLDGSGPRERDEAIEGLVLMRAKTAAGISAKARIVPILLEHRHGSELKQADQDFLLWFAHTLKTLSRRWFQTIRKKSRRDGCGHETSAGPAKCSLTHVPALARDVDPRKLNPRR
jgi:hypothetical protein